MSVIPKSVYEITFGFAGNLNDFRDNYFHEIIDEKLYPHSGSVDDYLTAMPESEILGYIYINVHPHDKFLETFDLHETESVIRMALIESGARL